MPQITCKSVKINVDGELLCPRCGFNYLHQSDENPFEYDGPAKHGGLAIPIWCESCGEDKASILKLDSHKGNMSLHWEFS